MSGATYHGTLYGVELADGTFVALARCAVGSRPDIGLITADTRAAIENGGPLYPKTGGRYRPIRAVYYTRRRPGGLKWRHELKNTAFQIGPSGPVFHNLSPGKAVRECAWLPGEFMCEG